MTERVFTFGKGKNLVGVSAEPADMSHIKNMPAVIILNAGLVHRVGPFRINVELARCLTDNGSLAFRFDLSGIGDSSKHRDSRSNEEQIVGDIQESMSFLTTKYGVETFVVIGLCTGAANAHKAAVADDRIIGVAFLDGYVYPTLGFYLRRYGPRLLKLAGWMNFVKARFASEGKVVDEEKVSQNDYFWTLPPKVKAAKELAGLVERGVSLLCIFSGGYVYYNHLGQYRDAFSKIDFKDSLQVKHFPKADHTYILKKDRENVIECIQSWVSDITTNKR